MNKRLEILFDLYLDGTITPPEKKELFRLISDPAHEKSVSKLMDKLWETLPDQAVSLLNREEAFAQIRHKIEESSQPSAKPQRSFWSVKIAAAAVVLLAVGAGVVLYNPATLFTSNEIFAVNNQQADPQFLRLPDGSTVLLNEGSKLEYPNTFDGDTREVYLQGEGFFDIKHDASKPFLVKTANVTTTVLGTAFNVRAFPSDKHITVTVTRGKVRVSKDEQVLGVVAHDQQIMVERQSAGIHQANVNVKESTGWMERDIHFNDVTMEDAVAELSNRFGVDIQLKNEQLRRCRFTATFVKGEDIEQILLVLTEFNNATFSYHKDDNVVVIDGGGCMTEAKP